MSEIEQDLYTRLTTDAGVLALVSTRVYPMAAPQDAALPNLAYQRVSGVHHIAHDGPSGVTRARVQITAMASTYAGVKALASAVIVALHGYKSGNVQAMIVDNTHDEYSNAFTASVVRLDVIVWYAE